MKLSAKQFGYLLRAPRSSRPFGYPPSTPHKAMWNKMVKIGLLDVSADGKAYRMTAVCEEVMAQFPASLSETTRNTLIDVIKHPRQVSADAPGLRTLIETQLVYYDRNDQIYACDQARSIACNMGWISQFSIQLQQVIDLASPGRPMDSVIEQVESLYYYDQDLIVLANVNGALHYGHMVEMNDHDHVWMYAAVTDAEAETIKANETPLRRIFAEADHVLVVRKTGDGFDLAWSVAGGDLPEDWLPEADVYLAPKSEGVVSPTI